MPEILTSPGFCASLGVNAAVWSGLSVVLVKKSLLFGISTMLVAAGFEVLAYVTLAPHVMGALGGLSMVVSVWYDEQTVSEFPWLAIMFVTTGAVVGLGGIEGREKQIKDSFVLIYAILIICGTIILATSLKWVHERPGSNVRFFLACSEALASLSGTSLIAYLGSGGTDWALLGLLLSGLLTVAFMSISLKHNSVREHVIISYSIWSTGLVLLDAAGKYSINIVAVVFQFTAILLGILCLINFRKQIPKNVERA